MTMQVGSGSNTYNWIDNWANIPDSESASKGWAHPGMVVTESGDVITCHAGDPTVMTFDKDGNLKGSWTGDFVDAHGITLVNEGGTDYLWIADNGSKRSHTHAYDYPPGAADKSGKVFKVTLDGQTIMELDQPPVDAYDSSRYAPTSISVNEERHGGNGDVWVADGYGASYVHRFSKDGQYLNSINGEEGAGRYNCPHGIFIDRRSRRPTR